jgi:exosortase D (VPLPA-CTERM-specific)
MWKNSTVFWVLLAISAIALGLTFYPGLKLMVGTWDASEEYSYGYLIPVISLFLLWQRKDTLQKYRLTGSWFGVGLVTLGALLYIVGELATIYVVVQYAFVIALAGLVLSYTGWKGFRPFIVPLFILLFMIPLPTFLYRGLSSELQLISSELGVWVIKLFGISVNLEGNVIDLGIYKLQVVEACSGLRYLFPLMVFGFITAYFFKVAMWKRVLVFLSTIPITILMNSFRIGVIGVTVEYWGIQMAEGFLHDFEGWVIFMACTGVLALEMWLLAKIGRDSRPLREVFGLELPQPPARGAEVRYRHIPGPVWGAMALLLVTIAFSQTLPDREEITPPREDFSSFPLNIGEWQGRGDRLERMVIDTLKFDDYVMVNYEDTRKSPVNFYVAYYGSQRKGESAHSPRSCIPGGGWQITDLSTKTLDNIKIGDVPLNVNRVVIKKGDYTQLVYYWFQQRGRVITNEYLVKWYLFWDALTKNRSDGALVRLTTFVDKDKELSEGDEILTRFARDVTPELEKHIPG